MNTQLQILSHSAEQTMQIASALGRRLHPGDVIALEGDLGSGKTVFVRGLAAGMGHNASSVSSPTFVICQEYVAERAPIHTLVHIDAYRISGVEDLETIGWTELVAARDSVIAVEWPSRIASELPRDRLITLSIDHVAGTQRMLTLSTESLTDRLSQLDLPPTPTASVRCRTCGRNVVADSPHFPFCSNRCRLADLGNWFSGSYRVSRPVERDEELED